MANEKFDVTVYLNHSIFIEENFSKIEKSEKDFIDGLLQKKIKVAVAAFINKSANTALQGVDKDALFNIVSLGQIDNGFDFFRKLNVYFKSLYYVFCSLRKSKFNYIFFPGNIAYLEIILSIILHKPFGLYVRGAWKESLFLNWLNTFFFSRAEFVFTTGPAFKESVSKYNSSVEEVVPMINIPDCYRNKPMQTNSVRLAFVGRITKAKGIYDVIEAVDILSRKSVDIELDIVGGGTDADLELIALLIKKYNLHSLVHMHGHISSAEKLAGIISGCKVFVFPTTFPEGFPRVIYEAMLLGVPVVTTSMPGAKGFLVNEDNCLITKPNCPEDLALKIDKLLNDKELHLKIKNNALSLVINKFNNLKYKNHADQVSYQLEKINYYEYTS